ncbi:vitellogenin receptor-like [Planococcus citri]|uniref:vitellogenin receptor-like n=1 Tax=Planococcus citri TaxID=170843 RepID=UPI0031F89880
MISLNIYQVLVSSCWILQVYSKLFSSGWVDADESWNPATASTYPLRNSSFPIHPERHFRCKDGNYISSDDFCAGNLTNGPVYTIIMSPERTISVQSFCRDGSHNSHGCDEMMCGRSKFKCDNESCLSISARCNTIKDCSDGSDELNCGDEINVGNCSLASGKFLCHDKLRCLNLEKTCDYECNCFDCSDESDNCTSINYELLDKCPNSYFNTPSGPMCLCDPNKPEMKNLCKEVEPCRKENSCSQRCFQFRSKMFCSCYDNYTFTEVRSSSGFICVSKVSYDNLLAYATSTAIKIVNMTSGENIFTKKKVQCDEVAGTRDHLYYTTYDDSDRKSIYKTAISSGATTKVIRSKSTIVSLAVDYITDNLYFTTNTSLSVCSSDGKICLQLKCCNVRYVALAPKFGLMFYVKKSDYQDDKFIMKSAMDGSNEDYMVDGGFRHFTPLAVDESTRKLYWSQQEGNEIWSLSFDEERADLRSIRYHGYLNYFTVLDSELFFTKFGDNEIYRVQNVERYAKYIKKYREFGYAIIDSSDGIFDENRHFVGSPAGKIYSPRTTVITLSDSNATRLVDNNVTFAIKNLFAYNRQWNALNKNPCSKTSCNGLCLIRGPSSMNTSNFVCVCENLALKSDQNWCNDFHQRSNPIAMEDLRDAEAGENEPLLLKSQSEETHGVFMVSAVLMAVFILSLLAFGVHFMSRKQSWPEYYDSLRNYCRFNKSIERVDITNQVEL